MLTDTHCHLDFQMFDKDRDKILENAANHNVTKIINPGTNIKTSNKALEMSDKYKVVSAAIGIHPNENIQPILPLIRDLRTLINHTNVVAIGEIGLDYFRKKTSPEYQKKLFRSQLDLASESNLPVIIHCREAYEDTISIVTEWQNAGGPLEHCGVFHSFSGTQEHAYRIIQQGFYIGVTGSITYNKSHELRQTIANVPKDKLLLETDAPFLSPHPNRGQRNEPSFLHWTANQVSKLKNTSLESIARSSTLNANALFNFTN
ncbi:MAG TPA: hydrolase TatD [Chloroflexi bacterium]|nr:hydrolase TatD [Chloroflexota bacterium]